MFSQKSKKFHSVLSFEANCLALNYPFSSILSKLTSKFEACMNTYFYNQTMSTSTLFHQKHRMINMILSRKSSLTRQDVVLARITRIACHNFVM